jgi:hypothetical protein
MPRQAEEQVVSRVYHQKEWEAESEELGLYIKERTQPDDLIFNYGRESQVYFYADRRPAIPYFYDWVLEYDEEALHQMVTDLEEAKPIYFIDSAQAPLFEDWSGAHPEELRTFLSENYDYAGRITFANVYRLKGTPAVNPDEPEAALTSELNPFVADNDPLE